MRSMGHIAVHFRDHKNNDDFSTSPEKKDHMLNQINAHLSTGGWICMYPEGQLHRGHGSCNTTTLQPFRVGGLKIALQHDMEIWAWVSKGNNDCWPRSAIGGLPSSIKARLIPLAPKGSCALLRSLKQLDPGETTEHDPDKLMDSLPLLVSHLQQRMQETLDDLYEGKQR
mmetsp:Transcript_25910/g.39027  ORF Transcript_25910/g.39027 Transcript_25910/m.39027 type:complete len:170 (-) Transcript_25910:186-695(-)